MREKKGQLLLAFCCVWRKLTSLTGAVLQNCLRVERLGVDLLDRDGPEAAKRYTYTKAVAQTVLLNAGFAIYHFDNLFAAALRAHAATGALVIIENNHVANHCLAPYLLRFF